MEQQETQPQKENNVALVLTGAILYLAALGSVWLGLHKIFYYDNSKYATYRINTYVSEDAYNYIINGTYSTTFCIIGLILAVAGSTCFIINAIGKK